MPAGGPDRIIIVPTCARTCTYVRYLLEQRAVEHGTTLAQEADAHALNAPDAGDPA